jgi:hypothetical protein
MSLNYFGIHLRHSVEYICFRDVHGGAAAADFLINHRGSGRFFKIHHGSGTFFKNSSRQRQHFFSRTLKKCMNLIEF